MAKVDSVPRELLLSCELVEFKAAEGEGAKNRKFSGVAYSGGKMQPGEFFRDVVIDLAGVRVDSGSRPILLHHDPTKIVGHTSSIEVGGTRIKVNGEISGVGDAAQEVMGASDNGFPWKMSVGGTVNKAVRVDDGETTEVNGKTFAGPLTVVRRFTLKEISFLPLAADNTTSAKVAASDSTAGEVVGVFGMDFEKWLEAKGFALADLDDKQTESLKATWEGEQEPAKKPVEPKAAPKADIKAAQEPTPLSLYRQEQAGETERINTVRTLCAQSTLGNDEASKLEATAIKDNWSAERTELEILRASRGQGPAIHSSSNGSGSGRALEAALCVSLGMDEKLAAKGINEPDIGEKDMNAAMSTQLRDATLHTLMDSVIRAAGTLYTGGYKTDGFIREAFKAEQQLQASGFTTLSLSKILGNVANKSLIRAYEATEIVHPFFTEMRTHTDFKVWSRYRLDGTGGFKKVGRDGELKEGGLSETEYTLQVDTHGETLTLTRTDIVNDDLNAFAQLPAKLGRDAAIKREEEVFKLLLSNPSSFFSAGNGNLLTGSTSALDIDSVQDGRQKFRDQTDGNKKPILSSPTILLVGTQHETLAGDLFTEDRVEITTTTDKRKFATNPHRGLFRPLVSPYLNNTGITDVDGVAISGQSATQWYMFANPIVISAIAMANLNGRQFPVIESKDVEFRFLGIIWRAYDDFGVGMGNEVAAVKSDGA